MAKLVMTFGMLSAMIAFSLLAVFASEFETGVWQDSFYAFYTMLAIVGVPVAVNIFNQWREKMSILDKDLKGIHSDFETIKLNFTNRSKYFEDRLQGLGKSLSDQNKAFNSQIKDLTDTFGDQNKAFNSQIKDLTDAFGEQNKSLTEAFGRVAIDINKISGNK